MHLHLMDTTEDALRLNINNSIYSYNFSLLWISLTNTIYLSINLRKYTSPNIQVKCMALSNLKMMQKSFTSKSFSSWGYFDIDIQHIFLLITFLFRNFNHTVKHPICDGFLTSLYKPLLHIHKSQSITCILLYLHNCVCVSRY